MTEELHEFEKAGYGPGPYQELDMKEDTDLGFCCDTCGQTGLRYKFELLSSTGQLFGVGSECIKKADPEMWLEMKQQYGSRTNITPKQVVKRKLWERGVALREECLSLASTFPEADVFAVPYAEVSSKRQSTFEAGIQALESCINSANRKWEQIGELRKLLQAHPKAINLLTRFQSLAWHIAENSGKTDRLKKVSALELSALMKRVDEIAPRFAA